MALDTGQEVSDGEAAAALRPRLFQPRGGRATGPASGSMTTVHETGSGPTCEPNDGQVFVVREPDAAFLGESLGWSPWIYQT